MRPSEPNSWSTAFAKWTARAAGEAGGNPRL